MTVNSSNYMEFGIVSTHSGILHKYLRSLRSFSLQVQLKEIQLGSQL